MSENEQAQSEQENKSTQNQEAESQEEKAKPTGADLLKNDLHRFKSEAKEAKEQNQKLMDKIAEIEEKQLQEKNNYKELYERAKNKLSEVEASKNETNEAFYNTLKRSAIKQFALKHGIVEESVEDLDLLEADIVDIEKTSTGKLNVIGAEEFIEELKTKRPHWFSKSKINVDTGNPEFERSKEMTPQQLLDLQKKDPVKYNEAMKKKLSFNTK